MFQNKKWLKVLVPELVMVAVTLGVFFGCQWFGMEDKEVAAVAAAVAAVAIAAAVAVAVAEEYKLPKFWVVVSYVAEALIIFLTIYFSF